jgi:ABC-type transporter Mla subunit MlaD
MPDREQSRQQSPIERLLGLPDLASIGTLPEILEQMERMTAAVEQVTENTKALPALLDHLQVVGDATVAMQKNTEALAEAIPGIAALGEDLPTVLDTVSTALAELQVSLRGMEAEVHSLAHVVEPLEGAAERLGRFADRLPQRRRDARRKADAAPVDDDDDVADHAQDAAV